MWNSWPWIPRFLMELRITLCSSEAVGTESFCLSLWPSPNSRCCPREFCRFWKQQSSCWVSLYLCISDNLEISWNLLNYFSCCKIRTFVPKCCIIVHYTVKAPRCEAEPDSLNCPQSASHCHNDLHSGRQYVALCTPVSLHRLSAMRTDPQK